MNETIIIALLIFIAWQDWQRRKERQEFFDYLKAKDIHELKEIRKKERPEPKSQKLERPELMPIEVATEEQFDKAIKKQLGRETLKERVAEKMRKAIGKANA